MCLCAFLCLFCVLFVLEGELMVGWLVGWLDVLFLFFVFDLILRICIFFLLSLRCIESRLKLGALKLH